MPYTEDRNTWYEGQGIWKDTPKSDWEDWTWQLRNRITSLEQLEPLIDLTEDEMKGCQHANKPLAVAITPYFFNLIDREDPECPIRKQVIP
ncbi:MAG: lysine 2,3-aminomutase, partial [Verrucomicrobiota bacterium]|nr:lysine 2,3-aminomutase [Verrucomicrobiota bacterium]